MLATATTSILSENALELTYNDGLVVLTVVVFDVRLQYDEPEQPGHLRPEVARKPQLEQPQEALQYMIALLAK